MAGRMPTHERFAHRKAGRRHFLLPADTLETSRFWIFWQVRKVTFEAFSSGIAEVESLSPRTVGADRYEVAAADDRLWDSLGDLRFDVLDASLTRTRAGTSTVHAARLCVGSRTPL